jgi:pimeloyl-ACP methyl ester carboxylesterase
VTSPPDVVNYPVDQLAGDVIGILDEVTASKAFIVRHDVGGAVTWYLLARYPDRFIRAAILAAPHFRVLLKTPGHKACSTTQALVHIPFSAPLVARNFPHRKDGKLDEVRFIRVTGLVGM